MSTTKQHTTNDTTDLNTEAVNTETNRIADSFKDFADQLPADGGLDARQTASLKQWLGKHEADLRATGAPPTPKPAAKSDDGKK